MDQGSKGASRPVSNQNGDLEITERMRAGNGWSGLKVGDFQGLYLSPIANIIRPGKLKSQFIVTNFSVLHAGGRSLFRFHISYSV